MLLASSIFTVCKVTPTSAKTHSPSLTRHFAVRWRFILNLHQTHKRDLYRGRLVTLCTDNPTAGLSNPETYRYLTGLILNVKGSFRAQLSRRYRQGQFRNCKRACQRIGRPIPFLQRRRLQSQSRPPQGASYKEGVTAFPSVLSIENRNKSSSLYATWCFIT
jgi:hypothetical protein